MKKLKRNKAYGAFEYILIIAGLIALALFFLNSIRAKKIEQTKNLQDKTQEAVDKMFNTVKTSNNKIIALSNNTSVIFLEDIETAEAKVEAFINANVRAEDKDGNDITDLLEVEKSINTFRLEEDFVRLQVLDQVAFIRVIKTVDYTSFNTDIIDIRPSALTIDSDSDEGFENKNVRIVFRKTEAGDVFLEIFDRMNYEKIYLTNVRDLEGFSFQGIGTTAVLSIQGNNRTLVNLEDFSKIETQAHTKNIHYNLRSSLNGDSEGFKDLLRSVRSVFEKEMSQGSVITSISILNDFNYQVIDFTEFEEINENNAFMFILDFKTESELEWDSEIIDVLDVSLDAESAFTSKIEIIKNCLGESCNNIAKMTSNSDISTNDFKNTEIRDLLNTYNVKHLEAENIERIGSNSFRNSSLENVNLINVKKIGNAAFENAKLNEIRFDKYLKEIESFAFNNNNIEEINIDPDHTEKIIVGARAFNRNRLKDIAINDKFESMNSHIFANQKNIVETVEFATPFPNQYVIANTKFKKLILNTSNNDFTSRKFGTTIEFDTLELEEIVIKKDFCFTEMSFTMRENNLDTSITTDLIRIENIQCNAFSDTIFKKIDNIWVKQ